MGSKLRRRPSTYKIVRCDQLRNPLLNPFQEKLAAANPQWIDSIEAAERGEDVLAGTPGLQRPDGDVEIGEEFLRKGLFKVSRFGRCSLSLQFVATIDKNGSANRLSSRRVIILRLARFQTDLYKGGGNHADNRDEL